MAVGKYKPAATLLERQKRNDRCHRWLRKFKAEDRKGYTMYLRRIRLRQLYGMTPADYDAMVAKQNGRCAVCETATTLVIDHCHATNKIRGLLCRSCNTAIGKLGDSAESLQRVVEYIRGADAS